MQEYHQSEMQEVFESSSMVTEGFHDRKQSFSSRKFSTKSFSDDSPAMSSSFTCEVNKGKQLKRINKSFKLFILIKAILPL